MLEPIAVPLCSSVPFVVKNKMHANREVLYNPLPCLEQMKERKPA